MPSENTAWYCPCRSSRVRSKLNVHAAAEVHISPTVNTTTPASTSTDATTGEPTPAEANIRQEAPNATLPSRFTRTAPPVVAARRDALTCNRITSAVFSTTDTAAMAAGARVWVVIHSGSATVSTAYLIAVTPHSTDTTTNQKSRNPAAHAGRCRVPRSGSGGSRAVSHTAPAAHTAPASSVTW